MKNIHLLPTGLPSRLSIIENKLMMSKFVDWESKPIDWEDGDGINQNIYITSAEDINENDYIITKDGRLVQVSYLLSKDMDGGLKVIMATDQNLIKDGVQAIDDEFLKWFVENPSCEEVEVKELLSNNGNAFYGYKIIIPDLWGEIFDWLEREEPKKETLDCPYDFTSRCTMGRCDCTPKKETLEEAKQRILDSNYLSLNDADIFEMGAEWQQEQILDFLYSEITERRDYSASKMCEKVAEFIEQFKKK
jgi:hypothetical protein